MKSEIGIILQCIKLIIVNRSTRNQYREIEFEVNAGIKGFKLIFKSKKNDIPNQR